VVAYPGPGGKWQITANGAAWYQWLPDGSGIVYLNPEGEASRVPITAQGANLEIGAPQSVLGGALEGVTNTVLTLSPDGKRVLAGKPLSSGGAESLTLVDNWAGELQSH
jgi:hypothetical protein